MSDINASRQKPFVTVLMGNTNAAIKAAKGTKELQVWIELYTSDFNTGTSFLLFPTFCSSNRTFIIVTEEERLHGLVISTQTTAVEIITFSWI